MSLPAVLDAILRAERLDPFGEQARTMRENLIGPHTDEDATVVAGYVWAEFGRLDEQGQPQRSDGRLRGAGPQRFRVHLLVLPHRPAPRPRSSPVR